MYGSVLAYNQKLRFIPVLELIKDLGKHWRASALLPFMANVNYKATKWFNVDMLAGLNGYSGGFQVQTPEEKSLRSENYRHIKIGVAANAHLFTVSMFRWKQALPLFGNCGHSTVPEKISHRTHLQPHLTLERVYATSQAGHACRQSLYEKNGPWRGGINW
jgi:hypothetical protein